jgi:uncharacterized protein (TIGR03118 family)
MPARPSSPNAAIGREQLLKRQRIAVCRTTITEHSVHFFSKVCIVPLAPVKAWLPARKKRTAPRRKFGYRLLLECLEDRCLMASGFLQVNLASDVPGLARVTDANLVNPWGISYSPTGPFWFADAGAGVSDVLDGDAGVIPLIAAIPAAHSGGVGSPTGTVFNGTSGFLISANGNTMPGIFLFATADGTISGWNGFVDPTHAIVAIDNSATGACYTGLAIANASGQTFLYAADFSHGNIDVFDSNFELVSQPGAFQDPNLPAGYAPFNVQSVGNTLVVAYAKRDASGNDTYGAGLGVVDIYTTSGALVNRLAAGGALNAPWGVALAPSNFGPFGGDLLVGNRGDGRISAFDPVTDRFVGQLANDSGTPLTIPGLWAITFGNDHLGGAANTLYFAAGSDNETHGLFGAIQSPQEHGEDTGGRFGYDASAPGEVDDYPVPPAIGPRLASDTERSEAVVALQSGAEGTLAIFPTITVVAAVSPAPSVPLAAASGIAPPATFFVATSVSAYQANDPSDIPAGANETALALHSFLNVNTYSAIPRDANARQMAAAQPSLATSFSDALPQRSSEEVADAVPGETAIGDAEQSHVATRAGWMGLVRNLAMIVAVPVLWGYLQLTGKKGAEDERAANKITLPLHQQK